MMFPFAGHSAMDNEKSVSKVGQQFLTMPMDTHRLHRELAPQPHWFTTKWSPFKTFKLRYTSSKLASISSSITLERERNQYQNQNKSLIWCSSFKFQLKRDFLDCGNNNGCSKVTGFTSHRHLHTTSEGSILLVMTTRVLKHITNHATSCRATDRILDQT